MKKAMTTRRWMIPAVLIASAAIWATTIVLAFEAMRRFESTPGIAAEAPERWPALSPIARTAGRPTLVMLVHPHCSCSRASVGELAAIIEAAPRTLQTFVLVYRPREYAPGWERTDIYRSASVLRRTTVMIDEDGREAGRFGGFTSGQALLYDGAGELRYAGGVTLLRGHAGLNRGRLDVIRLARSESGRGTHPVFGCAINSKVEGRQ
jgi:hypothetical protein